VRVHLIASKVTDSVVYGFLPAAARLGLELTIVTDQPEAHQHAIAAARDARRPGAIGTRIDPGQPEVVGGDPWDVRELVPRLAALPRADAVLTNSDHLQLQTALAAGYLGLPGKDWRAALRAKDKVLMRRRLAAAGTERVAAAEVTPDLITARGGPPPGLMYPALSYPAVLKPATGVASLAVGIAALTLLAAITFAFRGVIVGSLLGDAIAVQVRGVDYIAAGATVALGVLAVADVVFLNIAERAAELAVLRSFGWRDRVLARLVITEGALIGLAGSLAGAGLGLAGAAGLAGHLPARLLVTTAAIAATGIVVTAAATLLPAALLRHLPTAHLLAEE